MAPNQIDASHDGAGLRIGVIIARFNELITGRLADGALAGLREHGVAADMVDVAHVPGSFEIASAAMTMARSGRYDAIVCIGAVVRGETSHFDYVSMAVTQGVNRVALDTGVPCLFGVLTTDTMDQALARSSGTHSNRGYDAAVAAISMARLLSVLKEG